MNTAVRTWREALILRAERRLPALTRLRRPEPLPVELHRRRIYILPTGSGVGFGVLLAVMLVGALNYQNNAALLLTCLLGATVVNSMLSAFRALHGLRITRIQAGHACAGDPLPLHIEFDSGRRARQALCLDVDRATHAFSLDTRGGETTLAMATERRGWNRVPRMRISSTLPFGLFRAWSWITPEHDVLVYPRALAGPPPPPDEDDGAQRAHGDEDYAQLREYHFGDPLKRVAWKASARHDRLLIRELEFFGKSLCLLRLLLELRCLELQLHGLILELAGVYTRLVSRAPQSHAQDHNQRSDYYIDAERNEIAGIFRDDEVNPLDENQVSRDEPKY